jgi:N-acyl-D-aspartate/D-glutamate deacylase
MKTKNPYDVFFDLLIEERLEVIMVIFMMDDADIIRILRDGLDADIVIFDPKTIIDKSTFDNPAQPPAGISWVIVNGEVAVEHGQVTGATSGQVLRWG